jgi:hypothetical protein
LRRYSVEQMLREKIMQKFKDARVHLRRAFQSFDHDEDGQVNRAEFRGVLDRFNITPTAEARWFFPSSTIKFKHSTQVRWTIEPARLCEHSTLDSLSVGHVLFISSRSRVY